jgi:hypothetical protein
MDKRQQAIKILRNHEPEYSAILFQRPGASTVQGSALPLA